MNPKGKAVFGESLDKNAERQDKIPIRPMQ